MISRRHVAEGNPFFVEFTIIAKIRIRKLTKLCTIILFPLSVSITPFFSYLLLFLSRKYTQNISLAFHTQCIKYLSNEGKQKTFYHCSHDTQPKTPGRGMRAEKIALSFSWDVPHAYLLNISNDSNHGERCCRCVLYPILYVCYETRLSQQTHTLQLEGRREARNSLLGLRLIIWCRDGTFIPHREAMMMFTWHRNTRPADDDSALRSLADYSACSSFDALFSTNTHLSFFLLFTAQHDSMFFRFFLYDSGRLYWIQEKNLCCYYLKSFFFACKSCDFWGEGEELQRFYFSLLLRVLLTTIWQWESQKQFLVWWNPADRQLDIILPHVCLGRVRCDFCPVLIQLLE